jgi:hypothetical protein
LAPVPHVEVQSDANDTAAASAHAMQQHRDTRRLVGHFAVTGRSGGPRARRIQLVCNPADDLAFAAIADGLVESGVASPAGLQRLLEDRYPRVLVRARGLSNEEFDAWYVYREGSWTRSGGTVTDRG